MIKANELRIGNWYNHNGEYCQVSPSTILEVWESPRKWVQPIHLTPEILGKSEGFEMILWNGVFRQYYFSITNNTVLSLFFGEYIGFENRLDKVTFGTHPYYSGCTYGNFPVKYLHQLQNLYFALTGEELTFKP